MMASANLEVQNDTAAIKIDDTNAICQDEQ